MPIAKTTIPKLLDYVDSQIEIKIDKNGRLTKVDSIRRVLVSVGFVEEQEGVFLIRREKYSVVSAIKKEAISLAIVVKSYSPQIRVPDIIFTSLTEEEMLTAVKTSLNQLDEKIDTIR